jgi:hypothetical protein
VQERHEPSFAAEPWIQLMHQTFDKHRMLRDGEGVRTSCLAVPASDARQSVCDVFDLDVER